MDYATPRVPEVRGQLRCYRVRDIAEIDHELRRLAEWLAQRVGQASSKLGIEWIRRFRADQDLLLDARHRLMVERDEFVTSQGAVVA